VVLAAHEWSGEPENRGPRQHAQVGWVDADALPKDVETTASAVHRCLKGGPQVSFDGWK
jgi:Xylose isomerase